MTLILLEGVDGSGKSTLANAVLKELRRRLPHDEVATVHRSQLKRDPIDEYAFDLETYRPGEGRHVIGDRWHWGETIYGPLYRGESALDKSAFRWVELYLKARGATVWHVTASLETVSKRLASRGEDYLQSHHVEHVWDGFKHAASESMLHGGDAVTDQFTPEELAVRVVDEALYQEEEARRVFRPEYIGRALPHTLLVGDKQGPAEPGVTLAPFMARGASSGRFLLDALPSGWWHGVGLVNGHETKLPELLESLFEPSVVALGANASEVLNDLEIDHAIAPHPQKIRRFHHKLQVQYGMLLRELSMRGGNKLTWPK